jgi:hypothetical protein
MLLISTVVSAGAAIAGGEAQNKQAKAQANMEREKAKQENSARLRRSRLNLAASRVAAAGSNVDAGSTSLTLAEEDIQRQGLIERGGASYMSRYRQSALRAQGKAAKTSGYLQAGATLLEGGASAYSSHSASKLKKKKAADAAARKRARAT